MVEDVEMQDSHSELNESKNESEQTAEGTVDFSETRCRKWAFVMVPIESSQIHSS